MTNYVLLISYRVIFYLWRSITVICLCVYNLGCWHCVNMHWVLCSKRSVSLKKISKISKHVIGCCCVIKVLKCVVKLAEQKLVVRSAQLFNTGQVCDSIAYRKNMSNLHFWALIYMKCMNNDRKYHERHFVVCHVTYFGFHCMALPPS